MNTSKASDLRDQNGLNFDEWCEEATNPILEDDVLEGEIMEPLRKDLKAELTGEDGLEERERNFLDLLFEECSGNVRAAMDAAGYHKSVPASSITKKLSKHIKLRSRDFLVSQTATAAIGLVSVMIEPDKVGAKNIIAAAKEILDRGGVYKEEDTQVTEVRHMYILPPKDYAQIEDTKRD